MGEDPIKTPVIYVIAGPNGAGKTTFANEFLPGFVDCREFLNADLIAAGLSPFAPESQNFRAGRLLIDRIKELVLQKQDFAFETTLSGRGYLGKFREIKESGYRIMLFFLWLPNADLAVFRVRNRVRQGGHNVPEPIVRRRYKTGLHNLFHLYRSEVDALWLYDASRLPPTIIAQEEGDELIAHDGQLFQNIKKKIGTSNNG
jgi:predicted ABC-type ATPase